MTFSLFPARTLRKRPQLRLEMEVSGAAAGSSAIVLPFLSLGFSLNLSKAFSLSAASITNCSATFRSSSAISRCSSNFALPSREEFAAFLQPLRRSASLRRVVVRVRILVAVDRSVVGVISLPQ